MIKPRDIRREPWSYRPSDAWTDEAFRSAVLAFVRLYVGTRSWAESWDVTERFTDNGINVQVQRGPALLYDNTPAAEFRQRPGQPVLVIGVTRKARSAYGGRKRFEASAPFPRGVNTTALELDRLLSRIAQSLDAEHRRDRGI